MPPALSDEESSDGGRRVTTMRSSRSSRSLADDSRSVGPSDDEPAPKAASRGSEVDEDDEENDDLEEDVYIVEAIKTHMIDEDGSLRFQVKWEGYDSKKDLTWEPEENLEESAQEILDEYFRRVGGRENIFKETEKAAKGKKRGRAASNAATTSTKRLRKNGAHPSDSAPPATAKAWQPPAGSWEDEIATIDACEDEGSGKLVVYLIWKNGKKTKHETPVIYKKCPQKMLQFYERHVKIIREDAKMDI
ncbi:heterochromatin protein one [Metarhizium rileyi]|uniref:Heterochromatin protein one n=1 Tax=Metarhizium rileyi (strain RCEF 4871) TaxID=1649241 RepID=A0A167KIP8_METRR|nr:heterochromatin protein one [Metarhizium rileyi RCEF 4871]TWU77795.1 hypothetical protein ED733_008747 [Metarhizium rileyi]